MCFKVWEDLTIPDLCQARPIWRKGGANQSTLPGCRRLHRVRVEPYREANFLPHTGPFLFEFQRHGLAADEFFTRLDAFLGALPKDFRYAVEIAESRLARRSYRQILHNAWRRSRL